MMQQQLATASCPASAEVDAGICRKRHPNQQISSEAEAQEEVRATEEKWKEMKVGNGQSMLKHESKRGEHLGESTKRKIFRKMYGIM